MSLLDVIKNTQALLAKDAVAAPAAGAPATNPADVAMKTLGAVGEKVAALMQAMQANNGAAPPNLAAEVKTCMAALGTLAAPPAAPAAAPAGAAPGAPPGAAMKNDVAKAELDPYTALNVTLNSVRDRMWCVTDLMREKKLPEAKNEIAAVSAMMANAAQLADEVAGAAAPAAAPGAEVEGTVAAPAKSAGNVTLMMTEMGLTKYVGEQLGHAAKDAPEVAQKRLTHLKDVMAIAKAGFEQTGKEPIAIEVTMETVFAPFAGGGVKKEDLTVLSEQKVMELSLGSIPQKSDFDGSKVAKKFNDVHDYLKDALTNGSDFVAGGETRTEKSLDQKIDEHVDDTHWPLDLNAPLLTAKDIEKNDAGFGDKDLPFGRDFQG